MNHTAFLSIHLAHALKDPLWMGENSSAGLEIDLSILTSQPSVCMHAKRGRAISLLFVPFFFFFLFWVGRSLVSHLMNLVSIYSLCA